MAVAVLATAATLQAQTYNDTVRTHTWSVYIQGGGTLYHGMRGMDEIAKRKHIMPFGGVGVKYNIKPWVRLGLNLEYDMLRSTDKGMLSTTTNKDYEIKDALAEINDTSLSAEEYLKRALEIIANKKHG